MPFVKGKSGNPSGRRKLPNDQREVVTKIRAKLQACVPEAVDTLIDVMRNDSSGATRANAARTVLEYGAGKPEAVLHVETQHTTDLEAASPAERVKLLRAYLDQAELELLEQTRGAVQ